MHNHPSGDPKPSRDDIEMAKEIRAGEKRRRHRELEPS
jgi:DNA repair protein RadC